MLDINEKMKLFYLKLPNDTIEVHDFEFFGCYMLKTIAFNAVLKKIGNSAFANCLSLEQIELPNSLEEIGIEAFHRCINLKHVKLPSNIKKIAPLCFFRCTSLHEIVIPKSMQNIDLEAFDPSTLKVMHVSTNICTSSFIRKCQSYFENLQIKTYDHI